MRRAPSRRAQWANNGMSQVKQLYATRKTQKRNYRQRRRNRRDPVVHRQTYPTRKRRIKTHTGRLRPQVSRISAAMFAAVMIEGRGAIVVADTTALQHCRRVSEIFLSLALRSWYKSATRKRRSYNIIRNVSFTSLKAVRMTWRPIFTKRK